MSVKLNIDSQFFVSDKDASKDVRMEVTGQTVGDCLSQFLAAAPDLKREMFDKDGQLEKSTYLYVNKTPIFDDKLGHRLRDGDEITFLYSSLQP